MDIVVFYTESSIPKTGLSPTIIIRDVSNGNIIINGDTMTELGGGFYKYNFVEYNYSYNYAIICDAGDVMQDYERYIVVGNDSIVDDINVAINNNNLINQISNNIDTQGNNIAKILGLVHQNIQIDQTSYDQDGNLVSARIRLWEDGANVGSDIINPLATYIMTCGSNGAGKFNYWKQVEI